MGEGANCEIICKDDITHKLVRRKKKEIFSSSID
jgi:hypothetical protein